MSSSEVLEQLEANRAAIVRRHRDRLAVGEDRATVDAEFTRDLAKVDAEIAREQLPEAEKAAAQERAAEGDVGVLDEPAFREGNVSENHENGDGR